jgi:hypothetical protein
MSSAVADSLRELLGIEKKRYLEDRAEEGGTAEGFRQRIRKQYTKDPTKFVSLVLDALMEATTKKWQEPPRKRGPDLFAVGLPSGEEFIIPEYLTRPASYATGDDIDDDDESKFQKVDSKFGTINDLFDDATIKMRKAAQSSAAAEKEMQAADELRRRARGKMSAFLRDVVDKKPE